MQQWWAIDCEACVLLCESYLFIATLTYSFYYRWHLDCHKIVFDWSTSKHFSTLGQKKTLYIAIKFANSLPASIWLASSC